MAAAAITPRSSDTAFIPASLPALIFTVLSLFLTARGAPPPLASRSRARLRLASLRPLARAAGADALRAIKGSLYIGKPELLENGRRDRAVDHLLDRQRRLGDLDVPPARLRGRVTRREQRAAVLVRNDRDRICAKALRLAG